MYFCRKLIYTLGKEKNMSIEEYIKQIPKAELHIHIEGSFEPELMFKIAKRNGVKIAYDSVEELKAAYKFNNLQEFLDIYYEGASVLLKEEDFYDLTWAYLEKIHSQNVVHTEIFFDPQTHTERGVAFETVLTGIDRALQDAKEKLGITSKLIMSFLRHLTEESAFQTLNESHKFRSKIVAVGLDSSELGNPPSKFERVFSKAKERGFLTVAHAGEEGPSDYIWEAVNLLKVSRIDHGNTCLNDDRLVKNLARTKKALTLCPLSNLSLKVVSDLKDHPLTEMLSRKLRATINSDDPAYFGGYLNENYLEITKALDLTKDDILGLVKNSFEGSFLTPEEISVHIQKLEEFHETK